jgi:hypothetical protein
VCGLLSPGKAVEQITRVPMPLRFDLVPISFSLTELLPELESQRSNCGRLLATFTTTSKSPLSKSPKAQPRAGTGLVIPRASHVSYFFELAVPHVPVKQFLLGISGFCS